MYFLQTHMRQSEYNNIKSILDEDIIGSSSNSYDALTETAMLVHGKEYSALKLDLYISGLKNVTDKKIERIKTVPPFLYELIKRIPYIYKQHMTNYGNVVTQQRKIATVCARELRRGLSRTSKTNPYLKNKRINKELQKYVNRQQKEEKDKIKREDAENEMRKKNDAAQKEELLQQRKFNYLMSQTEAFANFFLNKQNRKDECEGDEGIRAAMSQMMGVREFDAGRIKHEVYVHEQVEQPRMLQAKLKEYQLKGLNWLVNLYNQGINGILADDMGLGKTIQSISLLGYLAESEGIWGPFLVITPASTIYNWENEFKKFLPEFETIVYYGSLQERIELRKRMKSINVVITSYQTAVSDESVFKRHKWQYMVLDEAQAIKSISSQRWKTLLGFKARNRCLLTGTPIQNNMQELWSLLHFIMPTLFDSLSEFSEWFLTDNGIDKTQVSKLHTILKPFMLRRHKDDIKDEIGNKEIINVYCELSARQRGLYDEIVSASCRYRKNVREDKTHCEYENVIMQLKKVCNHPDLFEKLEPRSAFAFEISGSGDYVGYRSYFRKYIPAFVQFNGVLGDLNEKFYHFFNQKNNGIFRDNYKEDGFKKLKIQSIENNINEKTESCEKQNRNSKFINEKTERIIKRFKIKKNEGFMCELKKQILDKNRLLEYQRHKIGFITPQLAVFPITTNLAIEKELTNIGPSVSYPPLGFYEKMTYVPPINTFITDSGKLIEIDRLLKTLQTANRRILIYFQMTKMMNLFEEYLIKMGYSYLRLDGSSKVSHRNDLVNNWQNNDIFIFMLSTRAGGVGLNLTAADTVIFYDSDWNPTVDQQAMDRVHRLGQTKDVTVYRLITKRSIEEKVMERANKKNEMQNIVIKGKMFEGN